MRVVQLVTQVDGGPVDHAADVSAALVQRGHDVHLVGPESVALARAAAAGVTVHHASMRHKTDVGGGRDVVRLLRRLRPAVLHAQDRRAGLIARGLAPAIRPRGGARATGIVYSLHGVADGLSDLVPGNLRAGPRRRRDTLYYLHGDRVLARLGGGRVVVPSRAVATYAVEHAGLPVGVVDIVPNGVDVRRFDAIAEAPEPEGPVTVLWLGGLVPVKRLDLLLAAAARVPGLHVRVVGDGPDGDALRDEASRRGLDGRVTFVGAVPDPAPELARTHVHALTSAAENLPLALLQAMAAGRAPVATAVGGVPEVVRDGTDGLLVPAGDVSALADALRRVTTDAGLRRSLSAAARERVRASFTLDQCVDGLLGSYDRARS